MSEINFFTPIYYGVHAKSLEEKAIERIDNYFNICGKKAVVIPGRIDDGKETVVLQTPKYSITTLFKTIGIALSILTVVIPITMLISKAVLRSSHSYKVIDSKDLNQTNESTKKIFKIENLEQADGELESEPQIPETTINKIRALVPLILEIEKNDEIEYLQGSKIFKLKEMPDFVFKMGVSSEIQKTWHKKTYFDDKDYMEDRFENMIKAREVCRINKLNLLIIPQAKKITFNIDDGRTCVIIAEECMDINQKEGIQEELYHTYSKELNETVRQLAIFIAKTGFNDVTPRNIPILNEPEDFHGSRRIALIDLEFMESSIEGFIGGSYGSCGLIGCVSEEQLDIVINEASNNSVFIDGDYEKRHRLSEIKSYKNLIQHYKNKGIVTGKEPLQVDINSLGLDLAEEGEIIVPSEGKDGEDREIKTVTICKAIEAVINAINNIIQEKTDKKTIKAIRYMLLNTNYPPLSYYYGVQIPKSEHTTAAKEPWVERIIKALVDKGHIFQLIKKNGHGFYLQV